MPETSEIPVQDLEGVLRGSLGPQTKVESLKWKHLTDPGENFGSLILAIDADVARDERPETLHLVAKLPPSSAYLIDLFNSPMVFYKEIYFYSTVAPAFLQLQLENGTPEKELIKLVPNFYGGRIGLDDGFDGQALVLLENLNYLGYVTQDRISGLDRRHIDFAVKELAKFHAIPIAMRVKKPKTFEEVVLPGLEAHINDTAIACVNDMVDKARANLKNMPQAQDYADSIDRTIDYALEIETSNAKKQSPWLTFVHGDFWVNNMMFKYDEGRISGLKIVDFQLGVYEYCVDDLIFFLLSSARKEVIDKSLQDVIDLYHESFLACLSSLKVDTKDFSKESFDRVLKERAPVRFPQCIMMVQVIKATRGSAPDVQSIDKKETFLNIGSGQLYNEKLLHIFQTFLKNGWLKK